MLQRSQCLTQEDIDDIIEAYKNQVTKLRSRQKLDKEKFKNQLKEKLSARKRVGPKSIDEVKKVEKCWFLVNFYIDHIVFYKIDHSWPTSDRRTDVTTTDMGTGTDDMLALEIIQQTDTITQVSEINSKQL